MTGRVFTPTDYAIHDAIKAERERILNALDKAAWTAWDPDTTPDGNDVVFLTEATHIVKGGQ